MSYPIYLIGERVLIPESRVLKAASIFTGILTLAIACFTIIAICKAAGLSFPKKADPYFKLYKTDPIIGFSVNAFLILAYSVTTYLAYQTGKEHKAHYHLPKFKQDMVFVEAPALKPGQFCYVAKPRDEKNREAVDQIMIVFGNDAQGNPQLTITCSASRITESNLMKRIGFGEATELVVKAKNS